MAHQTPHGCSERQWMKYFNACIAVRCSRGLKVLCRDLQGHHFFFFHAPIPTQTPRTGGEKNTKSRRDVHPAWCSCAFSLLTSPRLYSPTTNTKHQTLRLTAARRVPPDKTNPTVMLLQHSTRASRLSCEAGIRHRRAFRLHTKAELRLFPSPSATSIHQRLIIYSLPLPYPRLVILRGEQ